MDTAQRNCSFPVIFCGARDDRFISDIRRDHVKVMLLFKKSQIAGTHIIYDSIDTSGPEWQLAVLVDDISDLQIRRSVRDMLPHRLYSSFARRRDDKNTVVCKVVVTVAVEVLHRQFRKQYHLVVQIDVFKFLVDPETASVQVCHILVAVLVYRHQEQAVLIDRDILLAKIAVQEFIIVIKIL